MKKYKVGIIGATGYGGAELVRILLAHPCAELVAASSISFEGRALSEVYPSYGGFTGIKLADEDSVIAESDVVFAALPHGLSEPLAAKCVTAGRVLIDLGADFRLSEEAAYTEWYGLKYAQPDLHKNAVYSIPELHRERIKPGKTAIIANPGCYPTSIALALAPALSAGLIKTDGIVIDSKSGVTGAGRGLTLNTHFPETNEAFSAYKVGGHRHTPEIEETLSSLAGKKIKVLFVPHLLPVNRGIESTVYAELSRRVTPAEAREIYADFYSGERFVRVLPDGMCADIKTVRLSNYCDISVFVDSRTGRLAVSSVIDNMVKGAAGQAVQNMNILLELPEDSGLTAVPPAF